MFYLPPEAFDNEDFQYGLRLFVAPDGKAAKYVITHKGVPATPEGISHVDQLRQALRKRSREHRWTPQISTLVVRQQRTRTCAKCPCWI